jgi:hypothetical protein
VGHRTDGLAVNRSAIVDPAVAVEGLADESRASGGVPRYRTSVVGVRPDTSIFLLDVDRHLIASSPSALRVAVRRLVTVVRLNLPGLDAGADHQEGPSRCSNFSHCFSSPR